MTPGNRRKSSRSSVSRLILVPALTAIAFFLSPGAGTLTADAQTRACPERYAFIDVQPPYCFSEAGDVTEPMAIYRPAAASGCRRGYDRLGALCISPANGDVELAETPAGRQTSR